MSEIWVSKADGTVQCAPEGEGEIALDQMREELAKIIGKHNILDQEKRGPSGPVPEVCGIPTGNRNAYKITENGLFLLLRGFSGPNGFAVAREVSEDNDDAGSSSPFDTVDFYVKPPPVGGEPEGDIGKDLPLWPIAALQAANGDEGKIADILNHFLPTLTASGKQPDRISELIGRRCRVYYAGDRLSMDYAPRRVNVELGPQGIISSIWFG